jgi:hypothetical protein
MHSFCKTYSLLLFLWIFCSITAFAQQEVNRDTSEFFKNELDSVVNPDSASGNYIPEDILFIPAQILYCYKWDTLYVRIHQNAELNTQDTVTIILHGPKDNRFYYPVPGMFLSDFGWRGHRVHTGVDISLKAGDPVHCAFDGVVRISRTYHGYGNMVVVRHNNGIETLYAHLSKRLVQPNQKIKAGDVVGLGGHTGRATCNHLHFETRYLEEPFNPNFLIDVYNHKLWSDTLKLTSAAFSFPRHHQGYGSKKVNPNLVSHAVPEITTTDSPVVSNTKSTVHNTPGGTGNGSYYTIRQGDTLGKIARKYGTTVDKLCKLNNMKATDILKLGRKLKVK